MNLATLDNLAVNHRCWLQGCSLPAKALFVLALLASLLTSRSLVFMGGLALLLVAAAISNRLPLRILAPLVLAPMLFASIFALSLGHWQVGLVIIGRAGIAALAVALVFVTTPPVQVLGLLSAPMPPVFGELLYFTYRSLFLLWGALDNTLTAVRLRRGREGLSWGRFRATAQVYGMILLRAWDMAARQYSLLRLRGLGQGLRVNRDWRLRRADWALLLCILVLAAGWYYV
ncbi:MAG: energy-coupling factor transporter transmembrane component T family protein [Bacillota bacterium]